LSFLKNKKKTNLNKTIYSSPLFYKNFLSWLYKTFKTNNFSLRKSLFEGLRFKKFDKVLITGCGLGDDIFYLKNFFKKEIKIYAQDLSEDLILNLYRKIKYKKNIFLNISDAKNLPYSDNQFDVVFHFGGINLFGGMQKSIQEMHRVVKNRGIVRFGDESIAPWLRKSEYSSMLINNNSLWKKFSPINQIPFHSSDVKLTWLLENCFYLITYRKDIKFPNINLHIKHKSPRGGSIHSRYFK
jgi:ubiquinone/menaquinone biosynthesis C-methylase UbiE